MMGRREHKDGEEVATYWMPTDDDLQGAVINKILLSASINI